LRRQAATVREEMRDFSSALQCYEEALNIWPDDANLLAGKATVYQCLGQLDKAEKNFARTACANGGIVRRACNLLSSDFASSLSGGDRAVA